MRHTFKLDGIYFNPALPTDFNFTPHDERDEDMNWWWDKPYIIVYEPTQESWIEHYHRLKDDCDWSDEKIGTQEAFEKEQQEQRISWIKYWPTGFRYDVRCLDGGAWDRSTSHGMFATVEEALSVAKSLLE